jgi:hypothetical protein
MGWLLRRQGKEKGCFLILLFLDEKKGKTKQESDKKLILFFVWIQRSKNHPTT